ncbi:MAG: hypothetical protein K0R61_5582 [Microvirga sp.]|nr:hypothetical protein [Microvirga sp.]
MARFSGSVLLDDSDASSAPFRGSLSPCHSPRRTNQLPRQLRRALYRSMYPRLSFAAASTVIASTAASSVGYGSVICPTLPHCRVTTTTKQVAFERKTVLLPRVNP